MKFKKLLRRYYPYYLEISQWKTPLHDQMERIPSRTKYLGTYRAFDLGLADGQVVRHHLLKYKHKAKKDNCGQIIKQ